MEGIGHNERTVLLGHNTEKYRTSAIVNTVQGSQFTSLSFTDFLYESVSQANSLLGQYTDFYNAGRPYSHLNRRTPDSCLFQPFSTIDGSLTRTGRNPIDRTGFDCLDSWGHFFYLSL